MKNSTKTIMPCVGILAYGSLINEPGPELEPFIVSRIPCQTPFPVEYARTSKTRGGGVTLVPFEGGARVSAEILLLDKKATLEDAQDMLYRRETRTVNRNKKYNPNKIQTMDTVRIEQLPGFEGIDVVIYTAIQSNIPNLIASTLGDLAIESILGEAGVEEKDGIRYLRNAKLNGIATPFTSAYEDYILSHAKVATLDEAIEYFDTIRKRENCAPI